MGKQQLPLPLRRAPAVLHGSSSGSQGVTWVSRPCGMQTSILKRPAVLWCMSYCKAGESEVAFPAPQCICARLALEAQRWKREMKQFGNLPELSPGKQNLSPTVLPDQLWLAASKSLRKTMCWTLNLRPDSGVSMETDEPAVPHQLYSVSLEKRWTVIAAISQRHGGGVRPLQADLGSCCRAMWTIGLPSKNILKPLLPPKKEGGV